MAKSKEVEGKVEVIRSFALLWMTGQIGKRKKGLGSQGEGALWAVGLLTLLIEDESSYGSKVINLYWMIRTCLFLRSYR